MEKQCQTILKQVLHQGLLAMGVNRNIPQAVIHGPRIFQRLNIPNLYSEQMITHIQMVIIFGLHTMDPTGALVRACSTLLQLELGVGSPLFQILPHHYPCSTPTWLSSCWYYCVQWGIKITTDLPDIVPQWKNNKELMQIFLRVGFWLDKLVVLNHCQLFLHVIFLSDICNGAVTVVDNQFWSGEKPATHHVYHWLQTHKPMSREAMGVVAMGLNTRSEFGMK